MAQANANGNGTLGATTPATKDGTAALAVPAGQVKRIEADKAGGERTVKEKQPSPVSKRRFLDKAPTHKLIVEDQAMILAPRGFETGSYGWSYSGKLTLMVDGVAVPVQASINLTCIGSKLNKE